MRYRVWALLVSAILVCLISSCATPALTQKAKTKGTPAPKRHKAVTYRGVDKISASHVRRIFLETYKANGKRDPKWDANALSLLEYFLRRYDDAADGNHSGSSWSLAQDALAVMHSEDRAAIAQGEDAVAKGCDDPIVLTCLGFVQYVNKGFVESAQTFKKAMDGFEKNPKLPRDVARLAPIYLMYSKLRTHSLTPEDYHALIKPAIQWTAEAQCDGSFLPGENRIMYRYLCDSQSLENNLVAMYKAMKSVSKPDMYCTKVVGGMAEIKEAWNHRGNDYASRVTEEGWKGFEEHLAVARRLLTEAWKLNPSYPEAPTAMITIAMAGEDSSSPRQWFDRAVAAQMDYAGAYDRYERAILPRWGGSVEELHDFAIECLNSKRYDTWVPWRYLEILGTIRNETEGSRACWTAPETTKRLAEMFNGYEKSRIYDYVDPTFFPSLRAATAWYCGRNDEARQRCDALGSKLDTALFQEFSTPYETAKASMGKAPAVRKSPEIRL